MPEVGGQWRSADARLRCQPPRGKRDAPRAIYFCAPGAATLVREEDACSTPDLTNARTRDFPLAVRLRPLRSRPHVVCKLTKTRRLVRYMTSLDTRRASYCNDGRDANGQRLPRPKWNGRRRSLKKARKDWLGCQDSNLGMAESKSAALPLGYIPIRLANPSGKAGASSDGGAAQ
jgi:hypothetical protein